MNWQRAKTQLIIILLILNVVLLVMYFYNKENQAPYKISAAAKEELMEMLENSGITIDTEIPSSEETLGTLIVKYQENDAKDINRRFFDGDGEIEEDGELQRISSGDEEITIINNRRLLYENLEKYPTKIPGVEGNIQACETFLTQKGYDIEDMILVDIKEEEDHQIFEYTKTYKDMLIETSYTRLVLKDGAIKSVDRLWIDVIEESDRQKTLEPAYKSLLNFVGRDDLDGKTINSIRLCYYFNPEAQGVLEDNTKAERGRAVPAWRVGFSDGTVEVIDNY